MLASLVVIVVPKVLGGNSLGVMSAISLLASTWKLASECCGVPASAVIVCTDGPIPDSSVIDLTKHLQCLHVAMNRYLKLEVCFSL